MESILSALLIMGLRMIDVSLGTFRTIMVIQAKKYLAASIGFMEVLVWIFAMRYIFQNLDNTYNLIGYALGFALGNIVGISLEEKIADALRKAKFGVTILPAEGGSGGMSLIVILIRRRDLSKAKKIIDSIDKKSFMTVQHSRPYRGFIHGSRK